MSAPRRSLLPLLGLAAGLGLVGVATFSLWQSVRVAEERRNLDQRQRDEFVVTRIRAALVQPELLEHVADERRFAVRAGRVVVPPAVGSLDPSASPTAADLDALVRARLDRLADRDLREVMGGMVDDEARSDTERDWLAIDAAWRAHRAGDEEFRDAMLATLDDAEGGAVPASVALLWRRVRQRLPIWAPRRLAMLPVAEREGVLDRLDELGAETKAIRRRAVDVDRRRTLLRTVRASWRPGALGSARDLFTWTSRIGDRLLVFHRQAEGAAVAPERTTGAPRSSGVHGEGALLDVASFRAWVRALEDVPDSTIPHGTADRLQPLVGPDEIGRYETRREETARVVIADWVGLRPAALPATASSMWRGPGWLVAAALGLLWIAGAGLWSYVRSTRREAAAAKTQAEFLTMVTHELKTPLAGIRLLAELLQDGHVTDPARHREYYDRLGSESVRLSLLIENVLDLGRLDRGERSYDLRTLDLGQLTTDVVDLFRPIAEQDGMSVAVLGQSSAQVAGDRHALTQVLLNLLDNARKYGRRGQTIEVVVGDGEVLVLDDGPGLEGEERERVFERFRRGESQRDGSVPGVGLGLYLAREIVRQHGGSLAVIDGPVGPDGSAGATGAGACFAVRLPTAESARGSTGGSTRAST